jgi:hypothetical protein
MCWLEQIEATFHRLAILLNINCYLVRSFELVSTRGGFLSSRIDDREVTLIDHSRAPIGKPS